MIKRVKMSTIPPKRGVSAVTKKVYVEFETLQKELMKNTLGPYEAEMVVLEFSKSKPHTVRNATLKLLDLTKEFISKEHLPYRAFTRNGGTTLYVVGQERTRQAA